MTLKRTGLIIATCVVLVLGSGCGVTRLVGLVTPDPRLTDGGGGDLLSGGFKIMRGAMTMLTQDEVQHLSDQVHSVVSMTNPNVTLPPMTNVQADALVAFLQVNSVPGSPSTGLNSLNDLRQFLEAALTDPDVVVFPPGFLEAFADQLNLVDVSELDLESIFGAVLGGG